MSSLDYLDLCRLCLVKDRVSVPIFEDEGDVRQIFLKITACLPVKVGRDDKLPKKICDDCVYKVELFYQFWNTTANAEKQLLQWLGEVGGLEEKQGYVTDILNQNVMKQERNSENRLEGSLMQVSGHPNNMDINMMDENMTLSIPMMIPTGNQQISVPMDSVGNTVQAVPGPSTQASLDQVSQSQVAVSSRQDEEDETSDEDDNTDDDCDNEGLPVKEESEDDPNSSRNLEPATFVNVSLCDEAGPSGLQQQKISEMSEIAIPQTSDGDPKTENGLHLLQSRGLQCIDVSRLQMESVPVIRNEDHNYHALLPTDNYLFTKCSPISIESLKYSETKLVIFEESISMIIRNPVSKICEEPIIDTHKESPFKTLDGSIIQEPSYEEPKSMTNNDQQSNILKEAVFKTFNSLKVARVPKTNRNKLKYTCVYCVKEFSSLRTLKFHLKDKHKWERPLRLFKCTYCDMSFENDCLLKSHFVRRHTSHYYFNCEYCGKKFKIKGDLINHVSLYHMSQTYICELCGKPYGNQNSLYTHTKRNHIKSEHECHICKRGMATQANLDQHILMQHIRKERAVCEECGNTFSSVTSLNRHMNSMHFGIRPHVCHLCAKSFIRRSHLREHLLIHTGKRLFSCDVCGKKFKQKPGLISHRKLHPGNHKPLPVIRLDKALDELLSNK